MIHRKLLSLQQITDSMKQVNRWMLAAILIFCGLTIQAQETGKMVYPQAEWSKAGDILMHTPGQELFNGVIHPAAGLFEDYFDVDKAAAVWSSRAIRRS